VARFCLKKKKSKGSKEGRKEGKKEGMKRRSNLFKDIESLLSLINPDITELV
jgi:predicted transposase YdaD